MAIPFHRLQVCGDILVAARGASVHTFSLSQRTHISTWRATTTAKEEGAGSKTDELATAEDAEADAPPLKRPRLDSPAGGTSEAQGDASQQEEQPEQQQNTDQKKKKKKKKQKTTKPEKQDSATEASARAALRSADLPVVSLLAATADGRHVVVVFGHDKTVRVLAHDGQGHLAQISARTVPKRPCAVAVAAGLVAGDDDQQTILVGDKFGDVYALALIETEADKAAAAAAAEVAAAETRAAAIIPPLQLKANRLTVHTKGNLQALENQLRQQQLRQQQQGPAPTPTTATTSTESATTHGRLLLGHVSMLTALAVADPGLRPPNNAAHDGGRTVALLQTRRRRPLILTADRDEHIRVTRGFLDQTHVIETFCLGHTAFVSRLCVPAHHPDRLVSGGGDGTLRVWDFWPAGRTVGRVVALDPLVAAVFGGPESSSSSSSNNAQSSRVPKTAVSGLYTFGVGSDSDAAAVTSYMVVICERVPALFFFRLSPDGDTLTHQQTVVLDGHFPLDVAIEAGSNSRSSRLVVAVAPVEAADENEEDDGAAVGDVRSAIAGLWTVVASTWDDDRGGPVWSPADAPFAPPPLATKAETKAETMDAAGQRLDLAALRQQLLHSIESLRKDTSDERENGEH